MCFCAFTFKKMFSLKSLLLLSLTKKLLSGVQSLSLPTTQRLWFSSSVLAKKNADTDMTLAQPISLMQLQLQDAQPQALFLPAHRFSSRSHTVFASISNVSYNNLQSPPFAGDKRTCVREYTLLSTRLLSCEEGVTPENQMLCFPRDIKPLITNQLNTCMSVQMFHS